MLPESIPHTWSTHIGAAPPASSCDRRLVTFKLSNAPGLDKVSLNSIFGDPFIVSLIPSHLRKQISTPIQCWKYSSTIGSHWHKPKRIAQMSPDELDNIRNGTCNCSSYPDEYKRDVHLMTTSCDILPSQGLRALGKMGAKYCPYDYPCSLNSP